MTGSRIEAARVLTAAGWLAPAAVEVRDGRIAEVQALASPPSTAAAGVTLLPGFVDLQVNGIADVDAATADPAAFARLGELLLAQGTTTWCPTLTSAPLSAYAPWLESVQRASGRAGGSAIAGAHLEGPFLGSLPGVHPPEHIGPPDLGWLRALPDGVAIMTLGAEHPDAPAACRELSRRGTLVALGHTAPKEDLLEAMIAAGARLVTHCFNATGPIRARAPGLAGAALADERLAVSLIADLVHVHPSLLRLAFRSKKPGEVCLVTDSVAWQTLGLRLRDGAPRRADGTLAGTCITMDEAVRNVVGRCGVALEDAARAAATTPARLLRLEDRGTIEVGRRADLVALGPDGGVRGTWVGGLQVWGR